VVACADAAGCEGEPYATLCREGTCAECAGDGDCGPQALGPRCDPGPGYCTCAGDGDCVESAYGPVCHPIARACTCTSDRDCDEPAVCRLEPYLGAGVRTCRLE
jgi:hypothetical protein